MVYLHAQYMQILNHMQKLHFKMPEQKTINLNPGSRKNGCKIKQTAIYFANDTDMTCTTAGLI